MRNIFVIDVDNDAESRLLLLICYAAGIQVYRSAQAHGATLDKEISILEIVLASRKTEVWTIEIPGLATEKLLERNGINVLYIDHHTYGSLDRAHDQDGKRVPGSLEQFLQMAEITNEDLEQWGFEPKLVHGIAVMDDRFTRGLRDEGFTPEERRRILAYREMLDRQVTPDYDKIKVVAENVWTNKWKKGGYFICSSTSQLRTSYAVCTRSIQEALEEHPLILSDRGGRQIYVYNVTPDIIQKLENAFLGHKTFTFGLGLCWGLDNDINETPRITLEDILKILT